MKCHELQKQIDLRLKRGSHDLEPVYKEHIDSCNNCREYYNRAIQLHELLSSQEFEVFPGELDDITFEKIISISPRPEKKTWFLKNIISLRWAWVPAAVAAIFIMLAIFPRSVNYDFKNGTIEIIDWNRSFSTSIPEGLDSTAFSSFEINDSDLEILEEELLSESNVDNIIESLTDEEFDMLYKRLNAKSGSVG